MVSTMMFKVWVVRPVGEFIATDWKDNPAEAIVLLQLPELINEDAMSHADANETAEGFNVAEMAVRPGKPVKLWAIIADAQATLASRQQITVRSVQDG